MADPEDELDVEVDPPAEPDLEDEGLDTNEQGNETPEQPDVAAQPQDQQQPEPEQTRQPSRGENRFQTLRNDNQRLNGELAETRRRLDELARQVTQPRGESPEQRAQRFALMTPQEQMAETLRESEQRHAQQMQGFQAQMLDQADRTQFQAKAAVDPLYAKWGPKVEGKLAELRARGNNIEREVLLKFMIGEAALERRGSKEGKREVQQAQKRVQNARTKPSNSGSDTQTQRRQADSLERRLENQQI